MKRGTAAKVILGKDTLMDVPAGIVHGTDVILGGKAGLLNDFGGLVLSNNLMIGKKVSRGTITTVTVRGVAPIILPDAIAGSLQAVKAFGGTEQNGTPTPDAPIDIVSNNGVLKARHAPVSDPVEIYTDGTVETINAHGKNLFDKDGTYVNGFVNANTGVLTQGALQRCFIIPCKPNTTYTLSGMTANSTWGSFTSSAFNTTATTKITGNGSLTTGPNDKYIIGLALAYSSQNVIIIDYREILQVEQGSTATAYEPYYNGGTATTEMLLKVGDYQDEQEILSGNITRNVKVLVLSGTEDSWRDDGTSGQDSHSFRLELEESAVSVSSGISQSFCTHIDRIFRSSAATQTERPCIRFHLQGKYIYFYTVDNTTTLETFQQWLADQYAAGTPVIVIYPLATPTTESVTGQTLQVTDGDNILEITQASLNGLELEAQYNTQVQLTVQEVQDANLDNDVTVTII